MEGKPDSQRTIIMLLLRQKAVLARAQRIAKHSQEAVQRLVPPPGRDANRDIDAGSSPNKRN